MVIHSYCDLFSHLLKKEKQKQKKHLWSDEEHQKFVEAIDKYKRGNIVIFFPEIYQEFSIIDFKKVAAYIETRSVKQVRSHYQKYMLKINKQSGQSGQPGAVAASDKKDANEINIENQEKITEDKENRPGGNVKQEIKEANVE